MLAAKMLATVDVFSGGRLVVGVGAGWMREEFEAVGAPSFTERGAVTDEYLKAMKVLWTTDPASFEGKYVKFARVRCLPQPVQVPHPPIVVGGWSRAAMRRAAELGDGWQPPFGMGPEKGLGPARLGEQVTQLRDMAAAKGRNPESIEVYFRIPLRLNSRDYGGGRHVFNGAPDEVAGDIRQYAEAGVREFAMECLTADVAEMLDMISGFAADVRPLVPNS